MPPRHDTVHTNEHGSGHSLRRASKNFTFRGQSKRCLLCYTSLFSCSSPAWLCSFSISIIPFSRWQYHGLDFVQGCTYASHSCRCFGMTVHTTLRFLHRYGIFTVEYCSYCSEFSAGSYVGAATLVIQRYIQPWTAYTTYGRLMSDGLGVWKRNSKKLLSKHYQKSMAVL